MRPIVPLVCQLSELEQQNWLRLLSEALPDEQFAIPEQINSTQRELCEIAIVANPALEDLQSFPNLKWIHSLWAGVEKLLDTNSADSEALPSFKIVRMIDPQLTETMAEAVLAWTLYIHRQMPTYGAQQREKIWQPQPYTSPDQYTIGILGLGELGQTSALRLFKNGFQVAGWSRTPKQIPGVTSYCGEEGLKAMLPQCQVIICLLPLTKDTNGLLNKHFLSQLPKGASIINFSRGSVINIDDLLQSFAQGKLYHAVLDVFEQEPLDKDSVLWSHPNITVLPHISATTNPETAVSIVARNIQNYRQTGKLNSVVDIKKGY